MKKRIVLVIVALLLCFMSLPNAAVATSRTADEAINWVKSKVGQSVGYDYGTGYYQCVEFIQAYYEYLGVEPVSGNGADYATNALPDGWTRTAGGTPQKGDILVYSRYSSSVQQNGHVAIYESDNVLYDQDGSVYQATVKKENANYRTYTYNYWGCIHPDFTSEMPVGAGRTIPDGDYEIVVAADTKFRLDIAGSDVPAANGTNVCIYQRTTPPNDRNVFTVTYLNNGFYSIKQKGTTMSLDVAGYGLTDGTNIQVMPYEGNSAQQWSIAQTQTDNIWNAFSIQAKCNGLCVDAYGVFTNNQNVYMWQGNNTKAQGWLFIPYQPSQPVAEGRYVLMSMLDTAFELDPAGNTASVSTGTNVRVWDAASCQSRYNSFDFTKLGNGYYKITHAASGLALGVEGGGSDYGQNVALLTADGSDAQQWAVTKSGSGYMLRARSSGYALEVKSNDTLSNGINVQQYTPHGNKNQVWKLVQAEHKVTYNANGGSGAPGAQTKYYKTDLTLSSTKPTRSGYTFQGWATSSGATTAKYQPGASYASDANLTLYAVWTANQYTVTLNANGGSVSPTSITVTYASTYSSLPTPTRTGYTFAGWYTAASGGTKVTASTKVTATANHTLYAHWTANQYTVTFDASGGSSVPAQTVEYGNRASKPDDPAKDGYSFLGWFQEGATAAYDFDTLVTADVTLTALWEEAPWPVAVSGSVSGSCLTYAVSNAPAEALLIAARYDGGRLTEVQLVEVSGDADGTLLLGGSGSVYKLILVDGRCFAPLCDAWEGTA